MKRAARYLFLFFIAGGSPMVHGQAVVTGIVVDSASFAPLAFVNVQVKNTARGTTSDSKGNFGIIASGSDTLVFSILGYDRLELPLAGYEPSLIRMVERPTLLPPITVEDYTVNSPYEGMFDEQRLPGLREGIPFYYSRSRRDRVMAGRWRQQGLQVETYVNVVIKNPETKAQLMKKYDLTEKEYYAILTRFNETHHEIMYFLTAAELTSFLNRFFERETH